MMHLSFSRYITIVSFTFPFVTPSSIRFTNNWGGIQVRSTGTVDQITRQPIKGRKRGGGIRFGEMERDSLLAHGAAYLLHDRLHTCSDYHIADVCSLCGSILTSSSVQPQRRNVRQIGGLPPIRARKIICHACQTSKGMGKVAVPYVFRYLAAELASMNVKMTLKISNGVQKPWFDIPSY